MSKKFGKRTMFSMEQLLRASKLNLEEGRSLTSIAKEYGCGLDTLKKNMKENNIEYFVKSTGPEYGKKAGSSLKSFQRGLQGKKRVEAIRDKFKKNMYVKISYEYTSKTAGYRLKNKVQIRGIFKDYMLVQKNIDGTSIRECIRFVDIYTEDVEVKICQDKTA